MKKILLLAVSAVLLATSCSEDENKLNKSYDDCKTGDVTEITSTSAKISGYYNFFGLAGELLHDGMEQCDYDWKLSKEDFIEAYVDDPYYDQFLEILSTLQDDSLYMEFKVVDVDFLYGGIAISERKDFAQDEDFVFRPSDSKLKVYNLNQTITGLKSNTKYYYKTFIVYKYIYSMECKQLGFVTDDIFGADDYETYFNYGLTESFTTLP